jgi:hypothetical protein
MDWFISEVQKHIPKVTLVRNIQKYIGIATQYDRINSYVDLSQSVYTDVNYTEENISMCPSYNLRKESPNVDNIALLPITGTLRYLCDRSRWDI